MAARRGKTQARRSGAGKRSGVLAWLAAGLALGGLVFGYLHFSDDPKAAARQPAAARRIRTRTATPREQRRRGGRRPERPKPKYDFYNVLPEKEVVIPDTELARAGARGSGGRAAAAPAERRRR